MGIAGILWATLAIFTALLLVPAIDRGPEQAPLNRLGIVIPFVLVALAILALIVYGLVTPVASHIGMD